MGELARLNRQIRDYSSGATLVKSSAWPEKQSGVTACQPRKNSAHGSAFFIRPPKLFMSRTYGSRLRVTSGQNTGVDTGAVAVAARTMARPRFERHHYETGPHIEFNKVQLCIPSSSQKTVSGFETRTGSFISLLFISSPAVQLPAHFYPRAILERRADAAWCPSSTPRRRSPRPAWAPRTLHSSPGAMAQKGNVVESAAEI